MFLPRPLLTEIHVAPEAAEQEANLNGDDPSAVARMIEYMYTSEDSDSDEDVHSADQQGSYDANGEESNHAKIWNNLQVYVLAEKYNVKGLGSLAQTKSTALKGSDWTMSCYANLVRLVYETTISPNRGLRDIVKEVYSRDIPKLQVIED